MDILLKNISIFVIGYHIPPEYIPLSWRPGHPPQYELPVSYGANFRLD